MIPTRIATSTLLAAILVPAMDAAEPSVSVVLEPSVTTLPACPGSDLAVTVRIANPRRLEVGGYQLFVRFPADTFEVVRFEARAATGSVSVAGPAPIGSGFRPCASSLEDGWSDLTGQDVVGVVASVFGDGKTEALTDASTDVGRLHFRPRGEASPGATFASNVEKCADDFDGQTRVFDPDGRAIPVEAPAPVSVVVTDSGPAARDFACVDRGTSVDLSWRAPAGGGFVGYRIYRDGELFATLPLPGLVSFTDDAPPPGTLVYELAVLLSGGAEGCRLTCEVPRGGQTFVRGDSNRDAKVNISDAVTILDFLFRGGSLTCMDAGDVDDTGVVNLTDPIVLLRYLFEPGQAAPPPTPFPNPGADPTEDSLDCAS